MARRQVPALGGRPTCRDARQPRHQPRSAPLNSKRVPAPEPRTTGSQGHQAHWQSEMKNHRMEELRAPTAHTDTDRHATLASAVQRVRPSPVIVGVSTAGGSRRQMAAHSLAAGGTAAGSPVTSERENGCLETVWTSRGMKNNIS